MSQSYEVGQAIFILSKKGVLGVIPAVVCEVVARKTLSGDSISYQVLAETPKGNKIIDLSRFTDDIGEICISVTDLKTTLLKRVTGLVEETISKLETSVSSLVDEAKKPLPASEEVSTPSLKNPIVQPAIAHSEEALYDFITLPDGRKARVRIQMPNE